MIKFLIIMLLILVGWKNNSEKSKRNNLTSEKIKIRNLINLIPPLVKENYTEKFDGRFFQSHVVA